MENTLAEILRRQGRNGDTILAHINPQEAEMLKSIGGSGTINPNTGLPEFFFRGVRNFLKNPGKTVGKTFKNPRRTLADMIGTGAALFGGPVGGAIGGAARSVIRGDHENPLMGALKGAGYSVAAGTAANLAGKGLSSLGATGFGQGLQDYGTTASSSWLGHMGKLGEGTSGLSSLFGNSGNASMGLGVSAGDNPDDIARDLNSQYQANANTNAAHNHYIQKYSVLPQKEEKGFLDKLWSGTKDYASNPANLLSAGASLASLIGSQQDRREAKKERDRNRPKSLAEQIAEAKAIQAAMVPTYQEIDDQEDREIYRRKGRNARNAAYLATIPQVSPLHRKIHSPEEYARTGSWMSYYDNPQFSGAALPMKKGGKVKPVLFIEEEYITKSPGLSFYLEGLSGGQDDNVPAMLSNGEYVIDASTVADIGDGNNDAGANKLDMMVRKIRKHKRGGKTCLPPKAKSLLSYIG